MLYNASQYNTVQYNTIQYNAMRCGANQYTLSEERDTENSTSPDLLLL